MATLSDPVRMALFRQALSDWRCTGRILFKPIPWGWIRKELGGDHTKKGIGKILWDHVQSGVVSQGY